MLNKFYALGFLMVVVFSCENAGEPNDSEGVVDLTVADANLDWISGTWIDSTSFKMINQTYVEVWKVLEKDSYEGIKYSIRGGKNGDTTSLKIDKSEGKLYYTIVEDNKKSTFIQTKGASNEIEFANTKDEFPYNISYLNDNNKLTITASGNLNGEQRVIKFNTLKK
jgi:hypothetical protein